jgi:hypothetical protein
MRPCGMVPSKGRMALIGALGVEALGRVPGLALGLGRRLQVAAGQVDADREAEDRSALAKGDDQFDLVMKVAGRGRVGRVGAGRYDRVGRFGEEEWRVAVVAAHLAPVGGVVAADTQNAANGKRSVRSLDGDDRLRTDRYGVGHGALPKVFGGGWKRRGGSPVTPRFPVSTGHQAHRFCSEGPMRTATGPVAEGGATGRAWGRAWVSRRRRFPRSCPAFSRRSSRPRRRAGQIGSNSLTRWPGATSMSLGV